MFQVGVRAYMRGALLTMMLILAACSSSSAPKAQSSFQPSATPPPIALTPTPSGGSRLTWAAPVRVDHQVEGLGYNQVNGMSCPSSNLCVAVDEVGNVLTSSNPTGGARAWKVTHVDGPPNCDFFRVPCANLTSLSCPTVKLCVAGDERGNMLTSTNPGGGAAAWKVTHVAGVSVNFLGRVSCPTIRLCVAGDGGGNVVTSTNPTGGAAAWKVTHVYGSKCAPANPHCALMNVSCPSTSLCVAGAERGNVVTSTNPAGGAAAWKVTRVPGANDLSPVSCPSISLCVLMDVTGNVVSSSNPTGGPAAWTVTQVDGPEDYPSSVSCPDIRLCVVVDESGNVLTSTNPTGGAGAWTVTNVDSDRLVDVVCPTSGFCVADDVAGNVITSTNPAGGDAAWTLTNVDGDRDNGPGLTVVSCPNVDMCIVGDGRGGLVIGTPRA
jgi:hypothetical protein